MWTEKYEPPESIFDEIEPVACTVFLIALFAIILFTPLSPFAGREQSALDQLAGVNAPAGEIKVSDRMNAANRARQAEANIVTPVIR
jgi:hypothetical protein